jgi:macrocin-O-methyltransferase TylF-like protien
MDRFSSNCVNLSLRLLPHSVRQKRLLRLVRPFSLVQKPRLRSLYELAYRIESEKIPGDVVECGVYNGGTAAILAHFATRSPLQRTLWLFDSFEGMPQTTVRDGEAASQYVGQLAGNVETVRSVLALVGANLERAHIIKGWFEESFRSVTIPRIALLNIDADWYESVKLCLDMFYDAVVPGGFISIDDYGHWPGCKQAVDEFLVARGISPNLHVVDYSARWFQKV